MDSFHPPKPDVPDYYADLGVPEHASRDNIRKAYFKLAKKHHPDKTGPGKLVDAKEFRRIKEASDCLRDTAKRATYDATYSHLRKQWHIYREWQHIRRKNEEQRGAEEESRAAREEAEQKRKAAEAERARRKEAEKQAAREKAERERMREERVRQAEERSREAARRAREEQEQAAKERLRRERIWEAEKRSEEAARNLRTEQERNARERLKAFVIEEKQEAVRRNWEKMREAAENREAADRREPDPAPSQPAPSQSFTCIHPDFGWPKTTGKSSCGFCGEARRKWSFRCPECNMAACPGCKAKYFLGSI